MTDTEIRDRKAFLKLQALVLKLVERIEKLEEKIEEEKIEQDRTGLNRKEKGEDHGPILPNKA